MHKIYLNFNKFLGTISGNIHEISALEDGSFFFDILIPGYGDNIPCHYFEMPEVCSLSFRSSLHLKRSQRS